MAQSELYQKGATMRRQLMGDAAVERSAREIYSDTVMKKFIDVATETVAALAAQLGRRRFLTIVGPGGIGKTTLAVAVADAVRGSYADGVWLVEVASLADPDLLPSALGAVLGVPPSGANPLSGLAAWLREKQALIVFDSCEHVIGAAARFLTDNHRDLAGFGPVSRRSSSRTRSCGG